MGKFSRIVVNRDAVEQLLKVDAVPFLEEAGAAIAAAAGDGVEVETFIGRNRARVTVRTATYKAMLDEAQNRTLTRAIDAGRR